MSLRIYITVRTVAETHQRQLLREVVGFDDGRTQNRNDFTGLIDDFEPISLDGHRRIFPEIADHAKSAIAHRLSRRERVEHPIAVGILHVITVVHDCRRKQIITALHFNGAIRCNETPAIRRSLLERHIFHRVTLAARGHKKQEKQENEALELVHKVSYHNNVTNIMDLSINKTDRIKS